MTALLFATKLHAPPLRTNRVPRPSLIHKLEEGLRLNRRLTLVSAPAGFGKTTLLSEWMAVHEGPSAWVSLDEGDNDPARFWTYFTAAVRIAQGKESEFIAPGNSLPSLPSSAAQGGPEVALTALVNEIASAQTRFLLVLDDFHAITSSAVHHSLNILLDRLPPQMHLVIATRADPSIPMARLRARNQLTELRAADLRFNLRETSVFFRQVMGLELSKKNASTLEDRTEGWIAGLQLAALSIRGQENAAEIIAAFDGRQRYVMDYLLEEVLQRQPEEVREFLYQTSILDSLTASLCDAMTGRTDGATHLAYLERSNLFLIPLDDRREWYRYHHLFADILRAQIPARDRIELHRKAAEWHEANGFLAEAVKHAVATGDTEATGRAIANAAPEALNHGQVITLLGWLGALPDEHIRARFWLSLFKSWALEMTGEIEASGSYIDSAEKNLPSDSSRLEHGACTTVQAYLAYDRRDWTDAICLFEKALDLIEESNSGMKSAILVGLAQAQYAEGDVATSARSFRKAYDIGRKSGNFHAGYSAMSQLAWLLLEQGQRREVAALCEQSIERSADSRGNPLPISGLVHVALGHAYYQANELTRARQHLLTGLDLLARTHFLFHTVWGKTVLHRVHNALGDKSAAREVLEDTQLTLESLPSARTFFAACEADSNSRSGNITDAERWLAAHFSPADTAKPWQRNLYLLYARIQLAKGRQQEALQALSAIEPVLRRADGLSQMLPGGYFCTLTDLLILQALAEQAAGRQEAAFSRLEEAVQRSAPEGCHRVFLEEGATVAKLLPGVRSAAPEFVDQLIADFHAEAERRTSRIPDRTLTEPLTRRELEVLRLTKDGLRNQEIADRLVVSVDTVKRHLSNIYRKLGVSHRTQAIVCAQELHLI